MKKDGVPTPAQGRVSPPGGGVKYLGVLFNRRRLRDRLGVHLQGKRGR